MWIHFVDYTKAKYSFRAKVLLLTECFHSVVLIVFPYKRSEYILYHCQYLHSQSQKIWQYGTLGARSLNTPLELLNAGTTCTPGPLPFCSWSRNSPWHPRPALAVSPWPVVTHAFTAGPHYLPPSLPLTSSVSIAIVLHLPAPCKAQHVQ